MRIGLVTSYMPPHLGGIERIGENLFQGYARHGVEVRWLSSRIPARMPRVDGTRIRVSCFNLVEDVLGVPVPVWGLRGWRELDRLTRWADALHILECLYTTSGLAIRAAKRHGKPAVLTQNIGFIEYRFPLLNLIERAAYATLGSHVLRSASHIVLATPSASHYVSQLLGGLPSNSSVFPIGIDTVRFRPANAEERHASRGRLGVAVDRPTLMFAGRLVEKKGVPLVLEVARAMPDVLVLLAGDGPLRRLLEEPPENVIWLREVDAARMIDCYHAADAVLLPSIGEGLPLVVQEAMAAGLPAIISAQEIYARELSDVCATADRTVAGLVAAARRVLGPEWEHFSEGGRTYAEQHWSVDVMVERYLDLVAGLLSGRQSSGAVS
jgi:glycosyltransferase involved in cell wall biosynthesis